MSNVAASVGILARCWSWMVAAGMCLTTSVLASTAPPHDYYVLSPEPLTGPLSVMSLEPNNTIRVGGYATTLQQYDTATIPASAFTSGSKLSGSGFFTVGSNENAVDLLVPDDFAGTSFVVPHMAGSHRYYFLSPSGTAQVTVRIGTTVATLTTVQGVVNEFDAGSDNSVAGRITSSVPIVLTHVAYSSAGALDSYPVPPAASDLYGIRSQTTLVAALHDDTTVTVYASNATSNIYTLNAGQQVSITNGLSAAQGQGSALHVVASAPVAAVQYNDGDGSDAAAFWAVSNFGRRHGIPVNTQYLAVACHQPNVALTLYRGTTPPETQSCSGASMTPGKAYFGEAASGANLDTGWYLISSSPVYVMYEASSPEDEHNLLGLTPVVGPAAPTLNSVASPTINSPQSVFGTTSANQTVRLYVNGKPQATAMANSSGAYTFSATLFDGPNVLYVTAVASGNESNLSNAVSVVYNKMIPRSQSGTISGNGVWTPANPAAPGTVIAADLSIASGARPTLQPGAGASPTVRNGSNVTTSNQRVVQLNANSTASLQPGITAAQVAAGRVLYPLTPTELACGCTEANTVQDIAIGNLFRYGAIGDARTDNVTQWNRAMCSTGASPTHRVMTIPVGVFRFASKPNNINAALAIRGETTDTSILLADYDEKNTTLGFLQNTPGQGGIELSRFRVHKGATVRGGAGIALVSTPAAAAGFFYIDAVTVTTVGGTWNYAIFIDGENKITAPLGLRDLHITNSNFFGATTSVAVFYSVNAAHIDAAFFPAGGSTGVVRIGGTAAVPTTSFTLDAPFMTDVDLGYINGAKIRVAGSVNIVDSAVTLATTIEATSIGTDTRSRPVMGYIQSGTSGSGNVTLSTGCTTTPAIAYRYALSGRMASVSLQNDLLCTSNTTNAIFTGLPSAITPVNAHTFHGICSNNGAAAAICTCLVTGSSTITCNKDVQNGAWTAAGNKIIYAQTFTYPLD